MEKTPKTKSNTNITMPPKKKTDLEKAFSYYKVGEKSIPSIATQLRIKVGNMKVTKKDGTSYTRQVKPSDNPNSYYAIKVKDEIVKRWKTATQEYIKNYKMFFRRYDKDRKQWRDVYKTFSVKATKDNLDDYTELRFQGLMAELMENYPDIDEATFSMEVVGEGIPIQKADGIDAKTGVIYTSVKGGQRKVGRSNGKAMLKMRFTEMRIGKEEQVWDTKRGRCVIDYLLWKYKDVSGFKKALGKTEIINFKGIECSVSEAYLNELLRNDSYDDPLKIGVSVYDLENFCDEYGVPMYAFDVKGAMIEYYKPAKEGKGEPLIFTCYGEHFYPITDKYERKIKVGKSVYDGNKPVSADEEIIGAGKGTRKVKEIICPTEEEWEDHKEDIRIQKETSKALGDFIKTHNVPRGATEHWFKDKLLYNTYEKLKRETKDRVENNFQNLFVLDYLIKNDMEVPYPITEKSLVIEDNTIQKLEYDDKIILTRPVDNRMKKYMEGNEKQYQGETFVYAMNDIWKQLYPFELTKAPFLSSPNDNVFQALNAENVKHRTHMGRMTDEYDGDTIKQMLLDGKAIMVDIKRCYADCIYTQREEFIRFTGRERVDKYDGDPLTIGLYFVETDDNLLFHKSNWYSRKIIEKALKEKLKFRITHQIRCIDDKWSNWFKMPHITDDLLKRDETIRDEIIPTPETHRHLDMKCLFKEYCDAVIEQTEQDKDFSLTKQIINSLTGYLGKVNFKTKMVGLSNSIDEVWTDFIVPEAQSHSDIDMFVNPISKDDKTLYLFGYNSFQFNLTNGLPMYIQVLDWSNMALYDLMKNIGGTPVYRKTDMVVSVGGKLDEKYIADANGIYQDTFGTYYQDDDMEKIQGLSFHFKELGDERRVLKPVVDNEWKFNATFTSSSQWKEIVEYAIANGGLCIRGRAGTGKSYIIEKGVEAKMLPESEATRLAFTNRASRNINGTTIHKALAINKEGKTNNKTMEGQKKHKIFVVDEMSMNNAFLWNKLMLLKKKTNATFIVLGDHRQCPPIEDGVEVDYFNHPYTKHLCNFNLIELTEPQRYDLELWQWLEEYYEDGIEGDAIIKKKLEINDILYRKNICFYNKTRKDINEICMGMLKRDKTFVVLDYKGTDDKQQLAFIYKGLPLMAITNNKELETINSEEFWIEDFSVSNETITMYRDEDESDKITIEFKLFHKNFVVNYASTTHKSQGATINKGINIWDWNKLSEDRRLGYTAVSRAKKCSQVWINGVYEENFDVDNIL
jgi:hypothetical protein